MNEFTNNFYKYLINRENFYMKQYYSKALKEDSFVAIKELKNGIYCVIVSEDKYEGQITLECIEYLKTLGRPFSMNVVVLADESYSLIKDNVNINKLVVNKKDYKTIFYNENCQPLKTVLELLTVEKKYSKRLKKYNITTVILITINILIFLITSIFSRSIININTNVLVFFGAKYNPLIYSEQIWRLLTSGFLHGGIMHILFNMYALYAIGPQIEEIYGRKKYIMIYLISCITASALSVVASPNSISVGASGGIFGLMGALLVFAIIERHKIEKQYIWSLFQVILINLFIGLSTSNIDNFGHIGGFVGGSIIGYISYMSHKKNSVTVKK